MMKLGEIHPIYERYLADLESWAAKPSLWQGRAKYALREARKGYQYSGELLTGLQRVQRLRWVFVAGVENNAEFKAEFDRLKLPLFNKYGQPDIEDTLQFALADKLFAQVSKAKWDKPVLGIGLGTRLIGQRLVNLAMKQGIPAIVDFSDSTRGLALAHADEAGALALATDHLNAVNDTNIRISARPSVSAPVKMKKNDVNAKLWAEVMKDYGSRTSTGENFYTLTTIPTKLDAKNDGMTLKDLTKLHFEMVDQPWEQIGKAQEKLIEELDAVKVLRFTNDDGTDLSMNVDGFTFCNSLIAKNIPGSEAFSAPHRDSVEGIIVAKGQFIAPGASGIIKNLTLEFNKGRLVRYSAEEGLEHFEKAISVDEGARYVGEIGIGTNPHLKRHLTNILLVEKIGGSFHVALGQAYKFKEYMGKPVTVDNGNNSKLHWDITTMLHGKGGCIYADGRKIMENGKFIDAKYDVLNRGWAALPKSERPKYWKDYSGPAV